MDEVQEFSILDPKGLNTVAFVIENDHVDNEEIFTVKMLDNKQEDEDGKSKKTFYVDLENEMPAVTVIMLTIGKSKIVMNTAILENDELTVIKKPDTVKFEPIVNDSGENKYRDFKYTPNLKRPISIVDTETGEEVKPALYLDPETGDITGKCRMMPYRTYIAIEITK